MLAPLIARSACAPLVPCSPAAKRILRHQGVMAGLGRHANSYAIAKTMPVVTAVVYFLSKKYGPLNRHPKKVSFF
jgi:hypothetical protein